MLAVACGERREVSGMRKLDAFYNVMLELPAAEREARVQEVLWRTVEIARTEQERAADFSRMSPAARPSAQLRPRGPLPFSDLEARYLIGLDFRLSLVDVLGSIEERSDFGVLQTERSFLRRESSYVEMAGYGFEAYVYAFVLPYYRDRLKLVKSAQELVALNDLRAIAGPLHDNPKLRVFLNDNDFITRDEDVAWLREWVGPDHVSLFPTGGHLGNLHAPEVQTAIMDSLADLLPAQ